MLSGHCIFFSNNTKLINNFYTDFFDWLFKCESIFGFNLKDTITKEYILF